MRDAGPLKVTTAPSTSLLFAATRIVPFTCPCVGAAFHGMTGVSTAFVKKGGRFVSYAPGLFSEFHTVAAEVSSDGTA